MKSVIEAIKVIFNKPINIRTSPGSFDHTTVINTDDNLVLSQIIEITMKSAQLVFVNMASFLVYTAAAIKAISESGVNLKPEV